jgi:limonene-1,2-epoxide hydrolase
VGPDDPVAVVTRFLDAANHHDADALRACVHPEFESFQPLHPVRYFRGAGQLVSNWKAIFEAEPGFRLTLLRASTTGNTVWCEVHGAGASAEAAGIFIVGVEDGRMRWIRVYSDLVEPLPEDVRAATEAAVDSELEPERGPLRLVPRPMDAEGGEPAAAEDAAASAEEQGAPAALRVVDEGATEQAQLAVDQAVTAEPRFAEPAPGTEVAMAAEEAPGAEAASRLAETPAVEGTIEGAAPEEAPVTDEGPSAAPTIDDGPIEVLVGAADAPDAADEAVSGDVQPGGPLGHDDAQLVPAPELSGGTATGDDLQWARPDDGDETAAAAATAEEAEAAAAIAEEAEAGGTDDGGDDHRSPEGLGTAAGDRAASIAEDGRRARFWLLRRRVRS